LSVNVGTNLLSLVSLWLDKFCQITTKDATITFHLLFAKWTHPSHVAVQSLYFVAVAILVVMSAWFCSGGWDDSSAVNFCLIWECKRTNDWLVKVKSWFFK
jgi:hypothetical protein